MMSDIMKEVARNGNLRALNLDPSTFGSESMIKQAKYFGEVYLELMYYLELCEFPV